MGKSAVVGLLGKRASTLASSLDQLDDAIIALHFKPNDSIQIWSTK